MQYPVDPEARADALLTEMYNTFGLTSETKFVRLSQDVVSELEGYANYLTETNPYWLLESFYVVMENVLKANVADDNITTWMFDGTLIEINSIAYLQMQEWMVHTELLFRLGFAELGIRFSPTLDRANTRINKIGRRLTVRKPFWPFIHVREGVIRVRRVRKGSDVSSLIQIPDEWPRANPEGGLWSDQQIGMAKYRKKRSSFPDIHRY
jgi:hypothetical protein